MLYIQVVPVMEFYTLVMENVEIYLKKNLGVLLTKKQNAQIINILDLLTLPFKLVLVCST